MELSTWVNLVVSMMLLLSADSGTPIDPVTFTPPGCTYDR